MSIENNAENIEDNPIMDFPCTIVRIEGDKDISFSWEDNGLERYPSDRAFAIQEGMSENSSLYLFQLADKDSKGSRANRELWNIRLYDPKVYSVLINAGLEIVNKVNNIFPTKEIPISVLCNEVIINDKAYVITYMSPDICIAGISMRDNYAKRIKERAEEKRRRYLF